MRAISVFLALALLAGCSSSSTRADDPLVTLEATPDSFYRDVRLDEPLRVSTALPYGDGHGGFVWLDGAAATADRRGHVAGETPQLPLDIDLSFAVRKALDSADVQAWETTARASADSYATAQGGLHAGAVAQAVDWELVAYGVHRADAAGQRIAAKALVRLADAGSPDATLALHAVGRLVGSADARTLEQAGAKIAAAAEAWLERPYRPLLISTFKAGSQMRQSEAIAIRHQEQLMNQPAVQERWELGQAAEALARP